MRKYLFLASFIILVSLFFIADGDKLESESHANRKKITSDKRSKANSVFSSFKKAIINKVGEKKSYDNIDQSVAVNDLRVDSKKDAIENISKIMNLYDENSKDIQLRIIEIKRIQDKLKEWYAKSDREQPKIINLKPEYVFTLGLVLEKPLVDIVDESKDYEIDLSSVYAVKTFSESKDFNLIVGQNRFNTKVINLSSLNTIYGNQPNIEYKDDKTIGKASSVPSLPIGNVDNTN